MSRHLVAVYGTLRSGGYNNYLLANSDFLGVYETDGKAAMYSCGPFPYLVLGEPVSPIEVEVYEVDTGTLNSMDVLEGFSGPGAYNHYDRKMVDIKGLDRQAWIYYVGKDKVKGLPLIESGNWFVK